MQRFFWETIFWNIFSVLAPWLPEVEKNMSFYLRSSKNVFCGVRHVTLVPYKKQQNMNHFHTKKKSWMQQCAKTRRNDSRFTIGKYLYACNKGSSPVDLIILQKKAISNLWSVKGAFQRNQRQKSGILLWEERERKTQNAKRGQKVFFIF